MNVTILNLTANATPNEPLPVASGSPFSALLGTFAEICAAQLSTPTQNNSSLTALPAPSADIEQDGSIQQLPAKPASQKSFPKASSPPADLAVTLMPQPLPALPIALPLNPTQPSDVVLPASGTNSEATQLTSTNPAALASAELPPAVSTPLPAPFPHSIQGIDTIQPDTVPPSNSTVQNSAPPRPTLHAYFAEPSSLVPQFSSLEEPSRNSSPSTDSASPSRIVTDSTLAATPNQNVSTPTNSAATDGPMTAAPSLAAPSPKNASVTQSDTFNNSSPTVALNSDLAPDLTPTLSRSSVASTLSDLSVTAPENIGSPAQATVVTNDEQVCSGTSEPAPPPEDLVSPRSQSPDEADRCQTTLPRSTVAFPRSAKPPTLPPSATRSVIRVAAGTLNPRIFDEPVPGALPPNARAQLSHPADHNQDFAAVPVPSFADQPPSSSQTSAGRTASSAAPPATAQTPASQKASASASRQNDEASTNTSNPPQHKDPTPPAVAADPGQIVVSAPVIAIAAPAVKETTQPPSPSTTKLGSSDPAAQPDLSVAPKTIELPAANTPGPVQQAQIINKAAQSEMRIGLNTSAFGNVEVRTVIRASDVGLVIGSEKGDLRSLLSNDMPGIANNLQHQNLRLTQVSFQQQGFAFSGNSSSGGNAQPRSYAPRPVATPASAAERASPEITQPPETPSGRTGLSILA